MSGSMSFDAGVGAGVEGAGAGHGQGNDGVVLIPDG